MGRRVLSSASESTAATGKGTKYEATGYGATALNLMGGPGWVPTFKTATGTTPVEGRTIAVDRTVIPLHSLVRVECPTFPKINGEYTAEDVGGAIKGKKIDIYFNDIPPRDAHAARKRIMEFGRREVLVTVIRRGKG
jgi:3D (Asp-Asp-Asp) domain-containing protein